MCDKALVLPRVMRCVLQGQANREGYERDLEKTTAEETKTGGGEAIFVQAEVSNTQQVEKALRFAIGVNSSSRITTPTGEVVGELSASHPALVCSVPMRGRILCDEGVR